MWTMITTLATGLCVAGLVAVSLTILATLVKRPGAPAALTLPVWIRLLWPSGHAAIPLTARLAPPRLCQHAARALSQAGYADRLDAPHWLALHTALAVWMAVITALAGGLLGASLTTLCASVVAAAAAGALWPSLWLRERIDARRASMARDLPFVLDAATLCLEAGLNLPGALQQAAARGPAGPLRDELSLALAQIRAGHARMQALRAMAERVAVPGLRAVVAALAQADALGMAIAPVLRAQADGLRSKRFLRAERLAQQAPVKMLLPLVVCIFPCTFLVIGFPILVRLLAYV